MSSTLHKTIFDDEVFAKMLVLERKRTDRSQRPFLLLLLECQILKNDRRRPHYALCNAVIGALRLCLRQTDMVGWYKHDAVIGVICPELQEDDSVVDRIMEKVTTALKARLTLEQYHAVAITAHVYPPQASQASGATSPDEQLYPDLKQRTLADLLKRTVDILGSAMLLVLCAPVFAVIGVVIKRTSKGPILFKQTRVGQFGQPFTFLKFRSMYTDADPNVHEQYVQQFIGQSKHGSDALEALKQDGFFKLSNDTRVTPVGRLLRKTSLDELPQLLNVLAGTMSLVGPRPPIPYETRNYDTWHLRRVLESKPGLTGPWQVQGRSRTTFDEMVRLDLQYIDKRSLMTDLKLILQTPWAVLRGAGAR